jgi:hypothetical protein
VGYFNQEAIDKLKRGLAELPPQLRKLKAAYAGRAWAPARGSIGKNT